MRRHRKNDPTRPHPSQRPNRLDSRGHVMTPEEQRKEWSRRGLCKDCGMVQISRKVSLFGMKREVLTIPGKVYKGVCLQCNSLQHAKELLREADPSSSERRRHAVTAAADLSTSERNDGHQTGTLREVTEDHGRIEQHGVPQNIGPRMGGLQKQLSDITLDSTMRDLEIDHHVSHIDRNFNSLVDIVEDESSHNRDGLSAPTSTGNEESRPGAFPLEGGAMERLEARIRAKSDVHAAETSSSHVEFKSQGNIGISEELGLVDKRSTTYEELNRVHTEGSGNQDSLPGTAVSMTAGDRLNIYEQQLRLKNRQFLNTHPLAEGEKHTIQSDSDSGKRKVENHGHIRTKTDGSGAEESLPGTAVNMTGNRLNIYEERIRRKNAQSLVLKGYSSLSGPDNKASKSGNLSMSDWSSCNEKVNLELQRMKTHDSEAQCSIPSDPGTATSMTGDRLNVSEQRVHRKNDRFHRSLTEHLPHKPTLNERVASERVLSSVTESESKPGAVNMQGDLLNLYERRINQKTKQKEASTKPSDISTFNDKLAEKLKSSSSPKDESDGTNLGEHYEADKSASASHGSSSNGQPSKPGAYPGNNQGSGRLNLFEQRILEKKAASSDRSDSQYKEILERKIYMGDSEVRRKHHQRHTGEQAEYVAEFDVNAELSEMKASGSCDDIIGFLRLHSSKLAPSMIVFAFGCIQFILTKSYALSDKPHLFRSKVSWLKLFSSLMYTHFSNEDVQAEALKTLWSIASYSSRHAEDINANDEIIESIVDSMEAHQSEHVHEFGSGLIGSLAVLEEDDALSLLERCDSQIVQRLVSALTSNSCTGLSHLNAIKALTRLSTVYHHNRDGYFGDFIGRDIKDDMVDSPSAKSICAVLDAMHQYTNQALLQTEGCRLLCQLFVKDAILDEELYCAIADGVVNQIETITCSMQRNRDLDEALMYLLSSVSTYNLDSFDGDEFSFTGAVLGIMTAHDSPTIALHGCRFIYNVCSGGLENNTRSIVGASDGVAVILKCMSAFERNIEIAGEACGALFACCCDCPSNKIKVLDLGGIDMISSNAFNEQLDHLEDEEVLSLKMRACAALITLAVDPSALQEMQKLGVIEKFDAYLKDGQIYIRDSLRYKMEELVGMSLHDDASFDSAMNEDETREFLYLNLRAMLTSQLDHKQTHELQRNTISSMQQFSNNEDIQELGCKLLACMYGRGNVVCAHGMEEVIKCISSANVGLVAAAASACRNLCVMQAPPHDTQRLTNVIVQAVDAMITALQTHKNDQVVVEQVTPALWAVSAVERTAILSFESKQFINHIIGLFDTFSSTENQQSCIGLLQIFFSSTDKTMDYLTDELILMVIKCTQSDDEEVATIAINTTYAITEKGAFPARMMLLNHHEALIGAIIECMFKFPASSFVIRAACDVFSDISLDNYYRSAICNMGGIGRINESLVEFANDELSTTKALVSLTNLISGCDIDVLRLTNVADNVLNVMSNHSDALFVQVNGISAIWHLSSRDDIFKDILTDLGAVQHLSVAMNRFLTSEKVIRKGIVALWSLSSPRHLKAKVVRDGLASVVNGMSAHVSSEKVCEEGLGALKSMSTINKDTIELNDALDLVYSCMWLHSHNPGIQQASLAALVNLSVDAENNKISRITGEDLETIVEVMRIHQSTKAVQENAIILLRNFTFSPHNCRVLQENIYLAGLIREAMAKFHDSFQGRAEDLLRVLPADRQ